ncbi:MAG: hypothetical protein H0U53_02400 [Actinobacteria bacterium]|nr:hypothetical protein [Actinomycetota bacterium]
MKRFFLLLVVIAHVALLLSTQADARNRPNAGLNEIASAVADRNIQVWCEDSNAGWKNLTPWNADPKFSVFGFFDPSKASRVFLAPAICLPLHKALTHGYLKVDVARFSFAILTLIHEAVHASGVKSEAKANCAALYLMPAVLKAVFNMPTNHKTTVMKAARIIESDLPVEYRSGC